MEKIPTADTDIKNEKPTITPFMKQLYSTTCAVLLVISCCTALGYSAVLLPQLAEEKGNIQITPVTSSWIASMPGVPLPFSSLLGGYLVDRLGRKRTHQIGAVPITLGWFMITLSENLTFLLIGRFLCGITMGIQSTVSSIYIGELASPKHRSFFLPFIATAISGGVLISHVLGTFFHWKTVAIICSFFSFACGISVTYAPDTPSWLVSKKKIESATKSFKWYRGEKEMQELTTMIENQTKEKDLDDIKDQSKWAQLKVNIRNRGFAVPMIIMINLFTLLQFSGNNVVSFYSIQIIKETVGGDINEYAIMIGLDCLRLSCSMLSCVILGRYSKRIIVIICGCITCISLLSLAGFLYLSKVVNIPDSLSWIPIALLAIFSVAISTGVVPLPWSLLGEIFPLKYRSLGITCSTFYTSCLYFLAGFTAPYMFDSWGMSGAFCFYAVATFITVTVIFKMLPETKGKTLNEIEQYFMSGKKEDNI